MAIKVKVDQQDYGFKIVFGFFKEDGDKRLILVGDKWVPVDEGSNNLCTLMIPPEGKDEVLQQLADILGALGFKPAKLKAAQQEIDRLDNHLIDACVIRDRLLAILEKKT